jgi:hypothetical protein
MEKDLMQRRLVPAPDVLVQEVDDESVLLNLASEQYFGLDEVGTRMWQALSSCDSVQAAHDQLLKEYAVEEERLRSDLLDLVDQLVEHGLLAFDD